MTADAREALRRLVATLEEHLTAVTTKRADDDAMVDDAYEAVARAFEQYEEALDVAYAETLPLVVDDEEDDEEIDGHALEDDELEDDIDEFDLR